MSQEKVQFRFPSSKKKISAQVQGFGSLDDREVEESKNKEDHEEVSVRVLRFKEEGNTLADQGLFAQAILRWQKGIELDPENSVLYELQAQGYLAQDEFYLAVQRAKEAIKHAPQWADAHLTLGRALLNFGELDEAFKAFSSATEIDESNIEIREEWIEVNELRKRRDELLRQGESQLSELQSEDEIQIHQCRLHLSQRGQVL